jgi:hypothetical protein
LLKALRPPVYVLPAPDAMIASKLFLALEDDLLNSELKIAGREDRSVLAGLPKRPPDEVV